MIGVQAKVFDRKFYLNRDILKDDQFNEFVELPPKENIWNLFLWNKKIDNAGSLETGFWNKACLIDPFHLYAKSILTYDIAIKYIKRYSPPERFTKRKDILPKYHQNKNSIKWEGVVFAAQDPKDQSVRGSSLSDFYSQKKAEEIWFTFYKECCQYYGKTLLVKLHPFIHKYPDQKNGEKQIREIAKKYGCTVEHTDFSCLDNCDHVVVACSSFSIDSMMRGVRVKQGLPGYFYKTGAVTFCNMDPRKKCLNTIDDGFQLCEFLAWKYCFLRSLPAVKWAEILNSFVFSKELFPLPEHLSYAGYKI